MNVACRILCSLGCSQKDAPWVPQLWREKTDIISWSWIWYNLFPIAGFHSPLQQVLMFTFVQIVFCWLLHARHVRWFHGSVLFISISISQDEGNAPHLYVELDFKEVKLEMFIVILWVLLQCASLFCGIRNWSFWNRWSVGVRSETCSNLIYAFPSKCQLLFCFFFSRGLLC